MERATILRNTIRRILRRHARHPVVEIPDGEPLAPLLGFDSLALLLTVCDIEAELNVRVPIERVERLDALTLGAVVELVEAGQGQRAAAGSEADAAGGSLA